MTLKTLLANSKKSPFVKLYLRLLPTLIGLAVISAFLITQPELASDLANQFLTRLGIRSPQELSVDIDLVTPINEYRTQNSKKPLAQNDKLDHIARLSALTIADSPDDENAVDLKGLAAVAGYSYSTIAYLAAINPLPLVTQPPDIWIRDSGDDLLGDWTQIGSHYLRANINNQNQLVTIIVLGSPLSSQAPNLTSRPSYYTGVQLWEEIQKYRVEHGVNPFKQDNTLCTIASIRVNQLLELSKLDNHAGFGPLVDEFRDDGRLTHTNVAENILSGYPTAKEAVAAWDSSLGHQALMRDGAYVFGCAAANYGFAALIAAF